MRIKFTKMQGVGNDFVVIDAINQDLKLNRELCKALADRHFGIGADQVLVVQRASFAGVDFRYRIFNADGSEVEQCGNGSRAFVKFVSEKKLTDKKRIRVETLGGIIEPVLEDNGMITVNMGAPSQLPGRVGFDIRELKGQNVAKTTLWPLTLGEGDSEHTVQVVVISMGNPHAVQIVPRIDEAPVTSDGPLIEAHPRFSKRVNAGYMQIVSRREIRLRVFERGTGETLSCGTGACAAAVAGILRELLDSPVQVHTRGGSLSIAWEGEGKPVHMTGPAVTVFEGEIKLPH